MHCTTYITELQNIPFLQTCMRHHSQSPHAMFPNEGFTKDDIVRLAEAEQFVRLGTVECGHITSKRGQVAADELILKTHSS
jgi:hypothetical protein